MRWCCPYTSDTVLFWNIHVPSPSCWSPSFAIILSAFLVLSSSLLSIIPTGICTICKWSVSTLPSAVQLYAYGDWSFRVCSRLLELCQRVYMKLIQSISRLTCRGGSVRSPYVILVKRRLRDLFGRCRVLFRVALLSVFLHVVFGLRSTWLYILWWLHTCNVTRNAWNYIVTWDTDLLLTTVA